MGKRKKKQQPKPQLLDIDNLAVRLKIKRNNVVQLINTGIITGTSDSLNPRRLMFDLDNVNEQIRSAYTEKNDNGEGTPIDGAADDPATGDEVACDDDDDQTMEAHPSVPA